jgi:predicted O-methyltransferase YrrM
MSMTPERWTNISTYLDEVFGQEDQHLRELMPDAIGRGVPDIAVSASVGRMLGVLLKMINAKTVVEVGTLAGYSTTWLARALPDDGMVYAIEPDELHARIAREGFERAGIAHKVTVIVSTGLEALPCLVEDLGEGAVDAVFLDAIKSEYPAYLPHSKRLLRSGGLLIADNALGGGSWWIDDAPGSSEDRDGADGFNQLLAQDPDFESFCTTIREGVAVGLKV